MTQDVIRVEGQPVPRGDMQLGFGNEFTDHMLSMWYHEGRGWHDARIEPYHNLTLNPASMVLHYGQEAFEGLKAYRGEENGIYLFRHRDNFARLNASCERLVMPQVDIDYVSRALKQLILLDQNWIPRTEGCSLYIRPNIIAMDPFLGVRPSKSYLFYIIMSPVAAYYPEGFNPVKIFVSEKYVRAVPGGVGSAKTAGNYAASLKAQQEASAKGYTQVLWLDAVERRFVEEVGTMNIFFLFEDELCTSPLTGSLLPGITRDSVLKLAEHWGIKYAERKIPIDEVMEGAESGRLKECFGTGTAAIISPVKAISYKGKEVSVGDGGIGPVAKRFYEHILNLQYGRIEDPFGWVERIDK